MAPSPVGKCRKTSGVKKRESWEAKKAFKATSSPCADASPGWPFFHALQDSLRPVLDTLTGKDLQPCFSPKLICNLNSVMCDDLSWSLDTQLKVSQLGATPARHLPWEGAVGAFLPYPARHWTFLCSPYRHPVPPMAENCCFQLAI